MKVEMLANIAKNVTRMMTAVGAVVLAMMMFLTALDVGLRYVFNRPLVGAFELVEYMMAILIPFSIVYCAHKRGHVAVELILGQFPEKVQVCFDLVTTFLSILFVIVIAWQNFLYIHETYILGLTSAVLLIPTYPFMIPVAIGLVAFALNLMIHLFEFLLEVKKR